MRAGAYPRAPAVRIACGCGRRASCMRRAMLLRCVLADRSLRVSRSRRARVALAGSIPRVSHFTRRRRTFTRFRGRIAAGRARALLNVVGTLSASVSTLKSIVIVVSRPSHRVERTRFKPYLGSRPSRSSSSSSRLRAHVPSAQRVRLVTARTKRTSTLSFLTHGFLSRSRRRASV